MKSLRHGMDHDLYPFSPLPGRAPLTWPGGRPLAGAIFLYLEHWELLPSEGGVRDPRFADRFGDFTPDYRTYTWREYGNRVGIFRILEVLDRLGLPFSVAANAGACDRYPYLVDQLCARGCEFIAHGEHATRMITSRMSEDEERDYIDRSTKALLKATGKRPLGWLGQDYSESTRTPQLLAETGYRYLVDWPNDDQPYPMNTRPAILSVPNQSEWDDVQLLWLRRLPSPRFPDIVAEAAAQLVSEASASGSGRFMGLHIHPWLSGMPHRFAYAERALEIFAGTEGLWAASAGEIAGHGWNQLIGAEPARKDP